MVEVKVGGLVPDPKNPGSYILLLKVPGSTRYLPIWIGPAEANAIGMVLRNQHFERPLTHDLLQHVIQGLGASVVRVVITTIQESTFFARIFLERDHEILSVDARPSDSIALAVRVKCPIFLTSELLDSQQAHLVEIEDESAPSPAGAAGPGGAAEPVSSETLEDLMRSVERGEGRPPGVAGQPPGDASTDDPPDAPDAPDAPESGADDDPNDGPDRA